MGSGTKVMTKLICKHCGMPGVCHSLLIDGKPFVLVGSEEPPCSSTFQKPIGRKRIVIENPEGFDNE